MSFTSLLDLGDKQNLIEIEMIMKAFRRESDTEEIYDVQNIMEEGNVNDLAEYIRSILNYSFDRRANNAVEVDDSLIKLFRIAQLVIRFLLYCKSYLRKENTKLKIQLQKHDKLYRDCHVRKLEARELKEQLLQQADAEDVDSPEVSECSQCRKVFVNSTFLYAHHKRRHSDQPFPSSRSSVAIQSLKHEIDSLKSQIKKLSKRSEHNLDHVTISPIKMKVTNESSCLEAQEKYWRGKMKEMQDKFDEEMRIAKRSSKDIATENENLKQELESRLSRSKLTVAVQTEISLAVDFCSLNARIEHHSPSTSKQTLPNLPFHSNVPRNRHFAVLPNLPCHSNTPRCVEPVSNEHFPSKPIIIDSNVESSRCSSSNHIMHSNEYENLRYFQNSRLMTNSSDANEYDVLPFTKPDIIDEVDTFLENYEKLKDQMDARARIRNERRDNIGTVISKLFTETDGSVDRFAKKPIEVCENQRSIRDQSTCTNVENEYDPNSWPRTSTNARASFVSPSCNTERKTNSIDSVDTTFEAVEVTENKPADKSRSSRQKLKLQLIPFVRDIRSTIIKKYAKSRKTCSNIIENKITRRSSTAQPNQSIDQISNKTHNIAVENSRTVATSSEWVSNERYSLFGLPNERPLTSAMRKSKSTGNIAKKVAFSDDLPTLRAASEIDLNKVPESSLLGASTNHVDSVDMASIDYDVRSKPVPAPRTKKNANLCEGHYFISDSECDRCITEIEKNME